MAEITATAPIPASTTYDFDTRSESTNGKLRFVSVLGDATDKDGLAPVSSTQGLRVNFGADTFPISSLPIMPSLGSRNEYSNITGDFTATANVGFKTITLSVYASTVLSTVIGARNLVAGSVLKITSGGFVSVLPLTTVTYAANVFTLPDMASNFSTGDTVIVRLIGPDKGFDEAADAVKTREGYALGGENTISQLLGFAFKPVSDGIYAPLVNRGTGSVTKAVVKSSGGNVWSIYATNTNAAIRYLQIHNKSTAPAATEVPVRSWIIPAGSATNPGSCMFSTTYLVGSHRNETGLGVAISTTQTTFTDSATAAEHQWEVSFL